MDAIQMLQADLDKEKASVRAVVDAADAEGRAISDVERQSTKASIERITELTSRISDEQDKAAVRAAVDDFGKLQMGVPINPVREPAVQTKAWTPGEALVASPEFKSWSAAWKEHGRVQFSTPALDVPYGFKAAGDPTLESGNTELFGTGGNAGALSTMFGLETPSFVQRRLTVADLLPTVQITTGNSATYPIVKTRTAISGTPQTEGSAKPGGEYAFDVETKVLLTLAGWIKVSEQFLEDAPALAAYINADLPYQIRWNEENYLTAALYSAASAATAITGGALMWDGILDAVTTVRNNNFDPNAMVVHPNDWAILLSEKFVIAPASESGYVGSGPFAATGAPWGLQRVVVTQAATEGTPLVGDFSNGAKVYRRGGMSVTSTNADGTDFQKNLITVRAELREVIGVTYPEAFAEATVTS